MVIILSMRILTSLVVEMKMLDMLLSLGCREGKSDDKVVGGKRRRGCRGKATTSICSRMRIAISLPYKLQGLDMGDYT
jgi:hypothetical protein